MSEIGYIIGGVIEIKDYETKQTLGFIKFRDDLKRYNFESLPNVVIDCETYRTKIYPLVKRFNEQGVSYK